MRRNFFIQNKSIQIFLKFISSVLVGILAFIIMLIVTTAVYLKWQFSDSVLQIVLICITMIACCISTVTFERITKIKGIICGSIIGGSFSVIKVIMSLMSGGIKKGNAMIYVCIFSCSLVAGILSANRKKQKW